MVDSGIGTVVFPFLAVEEGSFTTIADSPGLKLWELASFTSGVSSATLSVAELLADVVTTLIVVPEVVANKGVPFTVLVNVDSSTWV